MRFERQYGHPVYGPDGEGAGGNPPPAAPPPVVTPPPEVTPPPAFAATVAPWAEAKEQPWTVADKPWWDTIPEQPVRELIAAKAYKTPHETALAYYNLNKMASSTRPTVPAEDAPPEAWDTFHKSLGRPDKATDYKIEPPAGTDAKYDPATVEFGQNLAHKLGLSQKQVETQLVPAWNEYVTKANTAAAEVARANNEAAITKIKETWGGEANVNAYTATAQRVVQSLGLSNDDLSALEANMGAAAVVNLMVKLGSKSGDGGGLAPVGDSGGGANPSGQIGAMTPQQAAEELKRQDSDTVFQKAYWDRNAPNQSDLIQRRVQLMNKAGSLYGG